MPHPAPSVRNGASQSLWDRGTTLGHGAYCERLAGDAARVQACQRGPSSLGAPPSQPRRARHGSSPPVSEDQKTRAGRGRTSNRRASTIVACGRSSRAGPSCWRTPEAWTRGRSGSRCPPNELARAHRQQATSFRTPVGQRLVTVRGRDGWEPSRLMSADRGRIPARNECQVPGVPRARMRSRSPRR